MIFVQFHGTHAWVGKGCPGLVLTPSCGVISKVKTGYRTVLQRIRCLSGSLNKPSVCFVMVGKKCQLIFLVEATAQS